jgi:hypothetical protein
MATATYTAGATPGPGTASATVDNGTATVNISIEAAPPTADADGPYSVSEGGSVGLDGSGSSDPNQPANTLTYEWDLDGDTIFGETGGAATRGDEVGINPTFSAVGLDGPSVVTVQLKVTNNGALSDTDSATINITNVPPVITSVSGPASGVPGQTLTGFSANFTDAGTPDTHTCTVNYGDGTGDFAGTVVETNGAGTCTGPDRAYTSPGTFTVTFTVTDDDLDFDSDSTTVAIAFANTQTGVCCAGTGTALVVGSLSVNTRIHINETGHGTLKVRIANRVTGGTVYDQTFAPPSAGSPRSSSSVKMLTTRSRSPDQSPFPSASMPAAATTTSKAVRETTF